MSERLAVVSGGGTGIGAEVARGLAQDGYSLVLVGRRQAPLDEVASRLDTDVRVVSADLADVSALDGVVEAVGDREVDVLVNNAGGFVGRDGDSLEDVAAQWQRSFDANVKTAVLLTTALLPRLRRPGGQIVLLSSIAAQRGGGGPYSAAKAALHGWCLDLAVQLGPEGITANVVSPGFIADTEFFTGRLTPEGYAARVAATLVGRAGRPADIADAIRWLAASGGYVTGQIINVNGGSVLGR